MRYMHLSLSHKTTAIALLDDRGADLMKPKMPLKREARGRRNRPSPTTKLRERSHDAKNSKSPEG
jgi:hypothetical protein